MNNNTGRTTLRLQLLFCTIVLLISSNALAHTGKISGVIKESNTGDPLVGATVTVSGKNIAVITDMFGKFRFASLDTGTYQLEVSYIGYQRKTVSVTVEADRTAHLSIILEPGAVQLADIMVAGHAREQNLSTISDVDIRLRPVNTSQDVLRLIPGLFIAQHAGGGKAEQIFLRGFDIDHGTDINLTVDGMPVNMVSHAHGQGYSDLHFVIPETIENVDFNKGPYNIRKGDFATAGYAAFETKRMLDNNLVKIEAGEYNTLRTVAMVKLLEHQTKDFTDQAYVATEYSRTDGYFVMPQDFNRLNLLARYTARRQDNQFFTISASTFTSRWDASGQIPERAVKSGMITRFGALDREGGETSRTNISLEYRKELDNGGFLKHQLYTSLYKFYLVSNFTFYLNDPENGDQITQQEERKIYGYTGEYSKETLLGSITLLHEFGGGFRYDDVDGIQLAHTLQRKTILEDKADGNIDQVNLLAFANETFTFFNRFSASAGVRLDNISFGYEDELDTVTVYRRNTVRKSIISPKVTLNYVLTPNTTLYLKGGYGFHSNDARVVVAKTGKQILPRAVGADLGAIWKPAPHIILQAALWALKLEQEFVYVGDEGIVEPSGKTLRQGVDLSLRSEFLNGFFADVDFNLTNPRATEEPEGMDHIPLAPTFTSAGGITYNSKYNLNGSLRFRYMGDRAANEDNSVVAKGYYIMDAVINYTLSKVTFSASCQNLFDTAWKEAQFLTESRLKDEPSPVSEIHFTPGTPRFFKFGVSVMF